VLNTERGLTVDDYDLSAINEAIRSIPDFPKKGIIFKDVTTLLKNGDLFAEAVDYMYDHYRNIDIDLVAGIEARGFIFGAALAYKLNVGFIPIRKSGKLPAKTIEETYSLEYGTDNLEMHEDAIAQDEKVLLVDDLLATGGSAEAACRLIERVGGIVVGIAFLIELAFLNGKNKIKDYDVHSLIVYQSE
jgi:adenine phosphoribosyltransferase